MFEALAGTPRNVPEILHILRTNIAECCPVILESDGSDVNKWSINY